MKLLLALLATTVGALVVSNGPRAPRATALSMSAEGAAAEMSKSKLQQVVKGLTKETFETIYEHEAWIEANAGRTLLAKTISRLQHKAKAFGVDSAVGTSTSDGTGSSATDVHGNALITVALATVAVIATAF